MSPEWTADFAAFLRDMGERPVGSYSLERINNDGNYEHGNCKWATKKEQQNNTRLSVFIVYGEERLSLSEWSERTGINRMTIYGRLRTGWSVREALTVPTGKNRVALGGHESQDRGFSA